MVGERRGSWDWRTVVSSNLFLAGTARACIGSLEVGSPTFGAAAIGRSAVETSEFQLSTSASTAPGRLELASLGFGGLTASANSGTRRLARRLLPARSRGRRALGSRDLDLAASAGSAGIARLRARQVAGRRNSRTGRREVRSSRSRRRNPARRRRRLEFARAYLARCSPAAPAAAAR